MHNLEQYHSFMEFWTANIMMSKEPTSHQTLKRLPAAYLMAYRGCNELSTLPAPRSWAIDWLLSGARTVDYYWVCSSYSA